MIWICAEIYIGSQHGYRLVTDEDIQDGAMKRMDAPDASVIKLIKENRLHDTNIKGAKLPVIYSGIPKKGTEDILTFIGMDGTFAMFCDLAGVIHRDNCLGNLKVWNAHKVKYITPVNNAADAYIYNNSTYKEFVDSLYDDSAQISEEKISKLNRRYALVGSTTTIDENGRLVAEHSKKPGEKIVISAGAIDTNFIRGYDTVKVTGNTLKTLRVSKGNIVDASECESLQTLILRNTPIDKVKWNKNLNHLIGLPNGIEIEGDVFNDTENLEFTSKFFDTSSTVHVLEIGNSVKQSIIPDAFARGLYYLKSIRLIGNITVVGNYAFSGSHDFDELILGDNIIEIGEGAFAALQGSGGNIDRVSVCRNQLQITGGKNVKTIKKFAFLGRRFPIVLDLRKFEHLERIESNAFNSYGVSELIMPDTVKVVSKDAFYDIFGGTEGKITLSRNLTDRSVINSVKGNRYCTVVCTPEQEEILRKSDDIRHQMNEYEVRR